VGLAAHRRMYPWEVAPRPAGLLDLFRSGSRRPSLARLCVVRSSQSATPQSASASRASTRRQRARGVLIAVLAAISTWLGAALLA